MQTAGPSSQGGQGAGGRGQGLAIVGVKGGARP